VLFLFKDEKVLHLFLTEQLASIKNNFGLLGITLVSHFQLTK